ncbi:multidrug efflux SMR transporter [uncultured Tessaracoccus sp.]|uniref:DMT family transporter n=1 Tax=uncultured Tessaracoccus sp. TaxID=905023 RepID=UPI0025E52E31|nr:multidrug efflux SMR transporter [uncultured Tessaracoccus sp.]
MGWVVLLVAGVLEAVWATALGDSDGLRRPVPTVVFVVGAVLSLVGLGVALQSLPTGTAYAVWTAVGASLTVVVAVARGKEPVSVAKVLLLAGIVACVVGLRVIA